jgi:putative ABC transport system permease protein
MHNIPVAWLQLTREKRRFAAALAGITFAVILMLMQLGLRAVLYSAATRIPDHLVGELVVTSAHYEYLYAARPFSRHVLYQVLAHDSVLSVAPMYLGMVTWREPVSGEEHRIFAIGFAPGQSPLELPGQAEYAAALHLPDTVLFDTGSRPEYGSIAELYRRNPRLVTEVNGVKVKVAGLVNLGATFGSGGHIVTSDVNCARLMGRPISLVDLGVIRLKPGADPQLVRDQLTALLPQQVQVMTREEFATRERDYWESRAAIGFIFDLGSVLGLVVGGIIVYQILYTDVTDHMKEYATLKALGYLDRHLYRFVLEQALILSALAFVPGYIVAHLLYILARDQAYVPMQMTVARAAFVFVVTVIMCSVAASVAMRKLQLADPAEIF